MSTIDASLYQLVAAATAEAVRPLADQIRALRAEVAAQGSRWVSRRDYASTMGISIDSVDRSIARGDLKSRRVGRSIRVQIEQSASNDEVAALAAEARRQG